MTFIYLSYACVYCARESDCVHGNHRPAVARLWVAFNAASAGGLAKWKLRLDIITMTIENLWDSFEKTPADYCF